MSEYIPLPDFKSEDLVQGWIDAAREDIYI
jgi:hypothetical protein